MEFFKRNENDHLVCFTIDNEPKCIKLVENGEQVEILFLQILSSICKRIQWFNLESSFVRHFLSANKYPNLCGLGLYNVDEETINFLFTGMNTF